MIVFFLNFGETFYCFFELFVPFSLHISINMTQLFSGIVCAMKSESSLIFLLLSQLLFFPGYPKSFYKHVYIFFCTSFNEKHVIIWFGMTVFFLNFGEMFYFVFESFFSIFRFSTSSILISFFRLLIFYPLFTSFDLYQ